MKKLLFAIAIILSTLTSESFATMVSAKLVSRFAYQDPDKGCNVLLSSNRYIYIIARVVDGKVVEAKFQNSQLTFTNSTEFLPEEITGIEVITDALGASIITSLPLSTRLLNWLFFYIDSFELPGGPFCRPPQQLATLSPQVHTYKFTQKEANLYASPEKRFKGTRVDGNPYSIILGFSQFAVD